MHAVRCCYDKSKYEEMFAYMTANSFFRKFLGPIIESSKEVLIFLILIFSTIFCQSLYTFFDNKFFYYYFCFFSFLSFSTISFGLFRLFFKRIKLFKSYKKIKKLGFDKKKAMAILFRLTDGEISNFSKIKKEQILKYFELNKNSSLRLKAIYLSYFV